MPWKSTRKEENHQPPSDMRKSTHELKIKPQKPPNHIVNKENWNHQFKEAEKIRKPTKIRQKS